MATQELRERASRHLLAESEPDTSEVSESEREMVSDTEKEEKEEVVSDTAEKEEEVVDSNVNQPESNANSGPLDSPGNPSSNSYVLRCTLLACITSALLGLGVGVLSETMSTIRKEQQTSDPHVELAAFIFHMIALIGSIMTGLISDYIGRRYTIILVGALFVFAPLLMALASNNFFVMLGRLFAQIGVGYTLTLAPVYVAEMSPASFRGFYTSLPQVFINAGIFIGCICNYFIYKSKFKGWPLMLCQGAITSLFLAIAILAMPESPQWLVLQGHVRDAHLILARTSKSNEEAELQLIKIMEAAGNEGFWDLLCPTTQSVKHIVICAIGIQFFRQACGVDTLLLYSPQIFERAGITFSDDKFLLTIGVEFIKMVFTLIATFLLDKFGRRPLLLSSIAGMIVSLFTLGMSLTEIDQSDNKDRWARTCIVSLFVCVASFSVGVGPVTSVYTAEIFPLRLRARGCAIAFAANQVASALMVFAFSWLYKTLTLSGAVNFFAVVACVAWVIFFLIIPETKGRTLEEMRLFFGELTGWDAVAREIDMQRSTVRQIQMQTMGRSDQGHSN